MATTVNEPINPNISRVNMARLKDEIASFKLVMIKVQTLTAKTPPLYL